METHVLEQTEDTRWIAELSQGGDPMPDGDYYVPQVRLETGTTLNMDADTWSMIEDAYNRLGNWDRVIRWASIFHGVNARIFTEHGYSQGDVYTMLTWPCKEWIKETGVDADYTPDAEDVSEFVNWARGDVYYVERQELQRFANLKDPTDVIDQWVRDYDEPGRIYYTDSPENITDYNN